MSQKSGIRGLFIAGTGVVLLLSCGCPPQTGNNTNDNDSSQIQWQLVLRNLPAALLSVSGTSLSDVLTVGADPGDGRGPYVLHYDGNEWRRLDSGASGDLWWISDRVIGNSFYMAGAGGLILRFDRDSRTFERQVTPGDELLFGVWGNDVNNIWAVGGDVDNLDTSGVIWRFDGNVWTVEDLSEIAPGRIPTLFKVWGRSNNEVYAVGFAGIALRFDGTSWAPIESGTTRRLFTVHGNETQTVAVGGFGDGVIVELEGDRFVDRTSPPTPQVNGVFIPPNGNGVAVGVEAAIAFRTSSGWELQQTGLSSETTRDFHATWVDPSGGIWAVGGNVVSDPLNEGILAHYGAPISSTTIVNP